MLILINPLVEVSLQEVDLLCVLQQSWPELLLQLLLSQNHLDVLGGVVDLALLRVDLAIELKLDIVVSLEGIRVSGEGKGGRLEVELELGCLDVRYANGQINEVLSGLGLVGSLSPKDCYIG